VFPNESLTSKTRRMFKKTTNYLKKTAKSVLSSGRLKTLAFMLLVGGGIAMAQNSAGDYTAGTTALTTVTEEIAKYVPIVVKLCYAIAGVVAVVGAISVYIAMNNEEQDVKKKIMMIVGACIFLVAAAQALPLFFGVTN
jgi:type IV secretory pathway VirB2 component (pilin)